jgi:putative membrane protein
MFSEILVRYVHFAGFIVIFGILTVEHVLLKGELTPAQLRRISLYDLAYGIAAVVALSAGLMLVYTVGKPSAFYTANPVFWTKLGIFIIVASISIIPTVFLLKNRQTSESVQVPRKIILALRWELSLLAAMPLLGAMMARGVGVNWF